MPTTTYVNLIEISPLQEKVMLFIQSWVKSRKTPVPMRQIVDGMAEQGVKTFTTRDALESLVKKGYIRRAQMTTYRTYFVQIRSL